MGGKGKESIRTRIEKASLRYRVFRSRKSILFLGLLVTIVLTSICIPEPVFFQYLDNKFYDLVSAQVPKPVPTPAPVIVEIDEKSLAAYGQWPWPRYRIARLLETIQADGAKGVGIDILFAEPDRTSPVILAKQLRKEFSVDMKIEQVPQYLMDNDALLARVLAEGPFALGFYFDFEGKDLTPGVSNIMKPFPLAVSRGPGGETPLDSLMWSKELVAPLEVLSNASRWTGFLNILSDSDGYTRKTALLITSRGKVYPSLALATLMQAEGWNGAVLKPSPDGAGSLVLSGKTVPLDPSGMMFLRYRGKSRTFPYYSAADILKGRVPKGTFEGKIVFVGTAAAGLQDLHDTPVDPALPGIELHATVVDNILRGDFVSIPLWTSKLETVLCLTIGVLSALLIVSASGIWIAVIIAFFAAVCWSGSIYWLSHSGVYFSPLSAFIVLFGNFSFMTPIKFWREERQKNFYHRAFSRYVAPSIVDQILNAPEKLSLVGEEREVSILFSDIKGFATLSESLSPTQVTALLHAYFTPMTRIITRNLGTVDKFIGDAIMAFWNAPLDIENHSGKAALSALEMVRKLAVLNDTVMKDMGVRIDSGIGLHCGCVRVGNMGSEDLFDYTIIGDNVNVASRVEKLTRVYGVSILVTESLAGACGGDFVCQEMDTVRVKGRMEPVTVFTLHDKGNAALLATELDSYNEALEHYKGGRFDRALGIFSALHAAFPGKTVYRIYCDRSRSLRENPPPDGWNLVYPPERG